MRDDSSLTPQEVADILKIAKNTVYELIKRGELEAYRVGRKVRIDPKDVEKYKNRGKKNSSTPNTMLSSQAAPLPSSHADAALNQNRTAANNIPLRKYSFNEKEFIVCGQDALLDILSRHLERHPNGVRTLRSYVGSYNGLYALYHGNASIATAHLWDGDSGEYNIPYVRRLLPGIPCVIIRLAYRIQGFYVSKGNPKKIKEWQDLTRADVLLINREKGSGTRILLDESLRRLNIPSWSVRGYDWEELSHLAVASTVARGDADVGVGNEKAAMQVSGISFIPLQKEKYDMIIKNEDMNLPHIQAIVQILNSKEFKAELQGIGGYDLNETGNIVAEI